MKVNSRGENNLFGYRGQVQVFKDQTFDVISQKLQQVSGTNLSRSQAFYCLKTWRTFWLTPRAEQKPCFGLACPQFPFPKMFTIVTSSFQFFLTIFFPEGAIEDRQTMACMVGRFSSSPPLFESCCNPRPIILFYFPYLLKRLTKLVSSYSAAIPHCF